MSWFSNWLGHQGKLGQAVNDIGGPIVKAVGTVTRAIPVVGQVQQGLEAVGNYMPNGANNSDSSNTPDASKGTSSGGWNLDKLGSTASGAIDAYNKNKQFSADIAYKQKMAQLTQDAQAMNDQQFAAKYGMDKSAAKAQVDEFNQNFGLASSQVASAAQGRMNTAGVRDQSTFMLQKLLGASPTAFHGRDLLAGGADALKTPGGGGALDAIKARAAAAAAYQPGMGGVKTTVDQGIIDKYANPTGVTYNDPGSYAGKTATAAGGYTPPTTPPVTPPAPQVAVVPPKITDTLTPGGDTTAKPTDTSILNTNAMDTLTDEDPATKARRLLTARLGGMV